MFPDGGWVPCTDFPEGGLNAAPQISEDGATEKSFCPPPPLQSNLEQSLMTFWTVDDSLRIYESSNQ